MKFYFLSLGCDKNLADSEHMIHILRDGGLVLTDSPEEADVLIVNTCAFIGDAKEESIREILRLGEYKKNHPEKILIVTGCLAERYSDSIFRELPEVDAIVGTASWDRILSAVKEARNGRKTIFKDRLTRLPVGNGRYLTGMPFSGFLKISEGCNKNCSYCIIPKLRGRYRSVPMKKLEEESKSLAENGVKELVLVAQETTLYGIDLYKRKALPELIRRLSKIDGIEWIRILYTYPEEITDELIHEMKVNPKVVPYIDMPIQHGADSVLKRMNRKTTNRKLRHLIQKLRKEIPDITLRTTIITGFPGETKEEFEILKKFIREMKFDRLGVFAYSKEEETAAYAMKNQIPKRTKESRKNKILKIQQEISKEHGRTLIGKTLDVLIEGRIPEEKNIYIGRTKMDAPEVDGYFFVTSPKELYSGEIIRAVVTEAYEYDLIGELVL